MESIDGLIVRFTHYKTKLGKSEPNWLMRCRNCSSNCNKRRGATPAHEKNYGLIEPLAFLHAWHDMEWPTAPNKTTHALNNPSQEAVSRFAEDHREELLEVCQRAGR